MTLSLTPKGLRRGPSRGRTLRPGLTDVPGRADVLALCSLFLDYPGPEFDASRPQLTRAVNGLPPSAAARLLVRFWDEFSGWDPDEARTQYVETFDLRRRSSLYLTYYLHGDTRQRGMALLMLKQRYRAAGFSPREDELPDYLPMVLEFAAQAGPGPGEAALRSHRVGIELLHRALIDRRSVHRHILAALSGVLGELGDRSRTAVEDLAISGPPTDTSGVDPAIPALGTMPYGPSEYTHRTKE